MHVHVFYSDEYEYVHSLLPACASEQGNVIGSVRIYIYIYVCVCVQKKKQTPFS